MRLPGQLEQVGSNPMRLARYAASVVGARARAAVVHRYYGRLVATPRAEITLRLPSIDIPQMADLSPALRPDAERLVSEADDVAAHRVEYLGSGMVSLGPRIDWHADFKSGYRWPARFYADVEVTRLHDRSDAKVPWELSRGHQFLTLARAWRLTGDERYLDALSEQLSSWLEENPSGIGINWTNPMEVAIRATNWVWALATVGADALERLPMREVTTSLQAHAAHVRHTLEGTSALRSNHFVADITGLYVLSLALAEDPRAARWERLARGALEREVRNQVLEDGSDFEASLSYHGLVLELLLVALVAGRLYNARPFSADYAARLRDMLDVGVSVRHEQGRVPLFGDGDSGRVLPAGFDRPATLDPVLWLAATTLEDADAPASGAPSPEVAWTLGVPGYARAAMLRRARPGSRRFPEGGWYVLRSHPWHVVCHCGDVGQNGNGGHGHNDLLSYELSYDGAPFVVDSGTFHYTADPVERNRFRGTAAHNVVQVDGQEANPIDEQLLFRLKQKAVGVEEEWHADTEGARFVGSHGGFTGRDGPVSHRRAIDVSCAGVEIHDEVRGGSGTYRVASYIHLDPRVSAAATADGRWILRRDRVELLLAGPRSTVVDTFVSDRFGVATRAPLLVAEIVTALPSLARWTFRVAEAEP